MTLIGVADKDRDLLIEELAQLGDIEDQQVDGERHRVVLTSSLSGDDIEAVMCFIVEPEQLEVRGLDSAAPASAAAESEPETNVEAEAAPEPAPAKPAAPAKAESSAKSADGGKKGGESTSIRVPVAKVDQIINLVGELIITQSMLNQVAEDSETINDCLLYTSPSPRDS